MYNKLYPYTDKPDPYYLTWHLIQRNSMGNDVRFAQTMLALFMPEDHGELVIDGFFGYNTQTAVMEFQQGNGMVADGIVGPMSWNRLAPTVSINYNYWRKEYAIREVQRLLGEGGYLAEDDADGLFGRKTETAIREFQAKYGLLVDGKWGPQCWNITAQGFR